MVYISTEIKISVSEFLSECEDTEIKQIIDWLKDEDYLYENKTIIDTTDIEPTWIKNVSKIIYNKHLLTNEDEEIINKISNKIP